MKTKELKKKLKELQKKTNKIKRINDKYRKALDSIEEAPSSEKELDKITVAYFEKMNDFNKDWKKSIKEIRKLQAKLVM